MNKKQQKGATFISWMLGSAIFIFLAITGVKLAPVYIEYQTIKGMVDELAADPDTKRASKRMFSSSLDKRLNINSLDRQLSSKNFELRKIKGSKNAREIAVNYEVRKPWFANLDFIASFNYVKEIGVE